MSEMSAHHEYREDINNVALELAPKVGGQRSLRDAYDTLLENEDAWSPLVSKWRDRWFRGDYRLAREQIANNLASSIQLALEIEDMFADMKSTSRRNPEGSLPVSPDNVIRIRVKPESRDVLDPTYLRYVMEYLYSRGYYDDYARGTAQQCISVRDIKQIPVQGGLKLGDLVLVSRLRSPDDFVDTDVLIQRVGSCGKVLSTRSRKNGRDSLKRKLMR